ncbi:hypothetical protein HPB51_013805 [Rhipicephalus microplus]|uniref:Uncharacterized protein n=1 Tax=Rhipicephalus microplus TaxID=6941 RepID=A0A9J6F3L4_RHIMP|nr:hypothetical protein HPB51_013805 [Rhipicephalus microplus]
MPEGTRGKLVVRTILGQQLEQKQRRKRYHRLLPASLFPIGSINLCVRLRTEPATQAARKTNNRTTPVHRACSADGRRCRAGFEAACRAMRMCVCAGGALTAWLPRKRNSGFCRKAKIFSTSPERNGTFRLYTYNVPMPRKKRKRKRKKRNYNVQSAPRRGGLVTKVEFTERYMRNDDYDAQHGPNTLGRGAPDSSQREGKSWPGPRGEGNGAAKGHTFPRHVLCKFAGAYLDKHSDTNTSTNAPDAFRPPPSNVRPKSESLFLSGIVRKQRTHTLFDAHARTRTHTCEYYVFQSAVQAYPSPRFSIPSNLETEA